MSASVTGMLILRQEKNVFDMSVVVSEKFFDGWQDMTMVSLSEYVKDDVVGIFDEFTV